MHPVGRTSLAIAFLYPLPPSPHGFVSFSPPSLTRSILFSSKDLCVITFFNVDFFIFVFEDREGVNTNKRISAFTRLKKFVFGDAEVKSLWRNVAARETHYGDLIVVVYSAMHLLKINCIISAVNTVHRHVYITLISPLPRNTLQIHLLEIE